MGYYFVNTGFKLLYEKYRILDDKIFNGATLWYEGMVEATTNHEPLLKTYLHNFPFLFLYYPYLSRYCPVFVLYFPAILLRISNWGGLGGVKMFHSYCSLKYRRQKRQAPTLKFKNISGDSESCRNLENSEIQGIILWNNI